MSTHLFCFVALLMGLVVLTTCVNAAPAADENAVNEVQEGSDSEDEVQDEEPAASSSVQSSYGGHGSGYGGGKYGGGYGKQVNEYGYAHAKVLVKKVCYGVNYAVGIKGIDVWCQENCSRGYCPASHCKCFALQ